MIPPCSVIRLSAACVLILTLLVMAPGKLPAVQIEPNPNPDGNTIAITPSTPRENLVSFSNLGRISIEALATFRNSSQFNNGRESFPPSGSDVNNSGTIINSGQFNNYTGVVTLQEGSRFNNLASGIYSGVSGSIGIGGTFVNESTVTHSLGYIVGRWSFL